MGGSGEGKKKKPHTELKSTTKNSAWSIINLFCTFTVVEALEKLAAPFNVPL